MLRTIYGGKETAQNLAIAASEIFTIENTIDAKREAIVKYNRITGKNKPIDTDVNVNKSWGEIISIKNDVYRYYEYVQLKRARFDCVGVEEDPGTGRIISMTFVFNGKFE